MINYEIHLKNGTILSGKRADYTDATDQVSRCIEDKDLSTDDIKFVVIGPPRT